MKRKIMILCFVLFAMLALAGCAKASVTSELKFNSDGSGSRSVYAVFSASDAQSMDGGIEGLDQLLHSAAPEGVTIHRSDADNGDLIYQFTFFFDNIEQYNEKIKQITGKDHNATWYTSTSVFLSNIEFTEDDCTTDLIAWAVEAIKSKVGAFSGNLNYELKKNDVYYDEKLQFSGTSNPSFVVKVAPKVTGVNVYTTYSFQNELTKKIEVLFEKGGLDRVNVTDAKALLDKYSSHYSLDRANNVITYDLKNEQVEEFLKNVDPVYSASNNVYKVEKNPFQQKYEITENYTLKSFLSLFDMTDSPYINDYVKLPAVMNGAQVSYTNSLGNVKIKEGYDYAGGYRYDEMYTASFLADQKIDLKDIEVNYTLDSALTMRRQVTVTYLKNGCEVSKEELEEYYKDYEDTIQVTEDGDNIKVNFIKNMKCGSNHTDDTDKLSSYKTSRGIKYAHYESKDDLDVTRYLPKIEGYTWDGQNIKYNYNIKIEQNASVTDLTIGNLTLSGSEELSTALKNGNYELSGSFDGTNHLYVRVKCKKMYDFFYMFVLLIVFILIAGGLVALLYYLRKEKLIDTGDYDDIDHMNQNK